MDLINRLVNGSVKTVGNADQTLNSVFSSVQSIANVVPYVFIGGSVLIIVGVLVSFTGMARAASAV